MIFEDRFEAGRLLAEKLEKYKTKNTIILAVPRGGLEIGSELAKQLNLELDIVVTKKIGAPHNPELAIGAVGLSTVFLNVDIVDMLGVPKGYIEKESKKLELLVKERYKEYRGDKPLPKLKGKMAIITDDGVATGATIISAIKYIKSQKPKKTIVAVPVCPKETLVKLQELADEVICLSTELYMGAVGACYKYFPQVTDEQAIKYLKLVNQ